MKIFCNEVVHWVLGHEAEHGQYKWGVLPLYRPQPFVYFFPKLLRNTTGAPPPRCNPQFKPKDLTLLKKETNSKEPKVQTN